MAVSEQDTEPAAAPRLTGEAGGYSAPRRRTFTRLDVSKDAWRALAGLNLYRWVVALTLTGAQFGGYSARVVGVTRPNLFAAGCFALLMMAIISTLIHRRRWPPLTAQIYLHICGDVALITLLAYSAQGVSSGLAMLLLPPIAAAGVLRSRRMSLLIAALASMALLGEEAIRGLDASPEVVNFTQAGILGGLFFLTVLATSLLEERIRESEALAERRGKDLANLAQLNERIVQRMQTGVVVVEDNGEVRMLNDAARIMLDLRETDGNYTLAQTSPALARSLQDWRKAPGRDPGTVSQQEGPPLLPHYSQLGPDSVSPVLVLLDDASRIDHQAQQMKLAALGRLSASIAHEIRNPLSAISHASQLLAESESIADSERQLLDILRRHITRINRVVENVLQLSRRSRALTEPVRLKPWLENMIADYSGHNENRPLHFDRQAVEDDLTVMVDPQQLQQVIYNLWDNTLQHSQDAEEVLIKLETGRFGGTRPYLDVTDNGPGITPEKAERIFEPFYTTAHQGTGLGLYLAQELCASNDARLQCMPHSGGSRFRIIFSAEGGQERTGT